MTQPDILTIPFGENAAPETINPIPAVRQSSDDPQQATWSEGFPRITMQPLVTGGIPPKGQDFNGVLKSISEHIVFQNAGGHYKWSAEWVAEKGGYPIGAILLSNDNKSAYINTLEGNSVDFNSTPESIGSSWLPWTGVQGTERFLGVLKLATTDEAKLLTNDQNVLTPKKLGDAMRSHSLGMDQRWRDQSTNRSPNITYTNTTGRVIAVSIFARPVSTGKTQLQLTVGGTYMARSAVPGASIGDGTNANVFSIIPPGDTYVLTIAIGDIQWMELTL